MKKFFTSSFFLFRDWQPRVFLRFLNIFLVNFFLDFFFGDFEVDNGTPLKMGRWFGLHVIFE